MKRLFHSLVALVLTANLLNGVRAEDKAAKKPKTSAKRRSSRPCARPSRPSSRSRSCAAPPITAAKSSARRRGRRTRLRRHQSPRRRRRESVTAILADGTECTAQVIVEDAAPRPGHPETVGTKQELHGHHLRAGSRPDGRRDGHRHRPSLRLRQHGLHGHHQRPGPRDHHADRRDADRT